MSFHDFIKNIQNKSKDDRIKIFVGVMILAAVVIFTVFGFSVKYVLQKSNTDDTDLIENKISDQIPSVMESIKASIVEVFKFKEEIENDINGVENKGSVEVVGGRLPVAR